MPWARSSWVSRAPGVLEATVDGDLVVFSPGSGEYAGLDGTAAHVWQLLGEPTTFGRLVDRLLTMYDVTRSECAPDVARCLEGLRRQGLVTQHQTS